MHLCAIHLPGNRQCPYPPLYSIVVGIATRRLVCMHHLVHAIDEELDLCRHRYGTSDIGVTVSMLSVDELDELAGVGRKG